MILLQMSDDEGLLGRYEVLLFPAVSNNGVCLGTPTAFTIVVLIGTGRYAV